MWEGITRTVLSGVVLAVFGELLRRGSGPWRAINRARHELEVAKLIEHDDELAARLRATADERIVRYLRPPRWRSAETKLTVLWGLIVALCAIVGLIVVGDKSDLWYVQVAIGALSALAAFAVTLNVSAGRRRPPIR